MSSKVQICNLALARLGAARITSLTDDTASAKLCNLMFDDLAEEVMMEGSWTSTITRVSLAKTTNTPTFGFTSEFQLPVSPFMLKLLEINEDTPGNFEHRVEGDKLLTNTDSVSIKYTARLTDTQSFDTQLKRCIVSRLTAELCYNVTGQQSTTEFWWDKYATDLSDALSIDGQQGSNELTSSPDLLEVR